MHTFGASAPLKELQKKFGFEPDQVVSVARELLRTTGRFFPPTNTPVEAKPAKPAYQLAQP
jgi:hypothetical protein